MMSRKQLVRTSTAVVAAVLVASFLATHRDQTQALGLGLGSGALISMIALAVVVSYKGSGTINFAAGAMAMLSGYVFHSLRVSGKLLLPPLPNPLAPIEGVLHQAGWKGHLPHWPTAVTIVSPSAHSSTNILVQATAMPTALAFILTVAYLGVLGLLLHLLVFRPLRQAPELAKVVASVGLLILMQAWVVLRYGSDSITTTPILPDPSYHLVKGIVLQGDQLWLVLIVLVAAALLWYLFRYTRFGVATRAAAGNEKGAVLLGLSPNFLGGVTWVLSSMLVSGFGILAAGVNGTIDPQTVTLLIVPALAAALLGGFAALSVTVWAGLGIGVVQSWLLLMSTESWFPKARGGAMPGIQQTLPFLVIVVALFVRGKSLPERGTLLRSSLPYAPHPSRVVRNSLVPSALAVAGLLTLSPNWRLGITNTVVGALICLSLVIVTGYVGQISLAQMTIAGVSGFALAKLAGSAGIPFPFAPLIGALMAVVFGLLVAVPALRVRGVSLAVVTFAMAVAVEQMVFDNPAWSGEGGAQVGSPSLFGWKFGPDNRTFLNPGSLPDPFFGLVCVLAAVVLAVVVAHLRRSAPGKRMLAVRSNESAAAASGINVARTKMVGFGVAAFIAGMAGALSAYRFGSVTSTYFGAIASLQFFAIAYLGGITSITGAFIGGMLVANGLVTVAMQSWFSISPQYTLLLGGLGMTVTAVLNPAGVAGGLRLTQQQLKKQLAERRLAPAPAMMGPDAS